MAVSSNDMILSQQIEEIGHKLAEFPAEVDVLLPVLDVSRLFVFRFFDKLAALC